MLISTQLDKFDFAEYKRIVGDDNVSKLKYFQDLGVMLYAEQHFPDMDIKEAIQEALNVFPSADGLRKTYMESLLQSNKPEEKPCCGGGQVR